MIFKSGLRFPAGDGPGCGSRIAVHSGRDSRHTQITTQGEEGMPSLVMMIGLFCLALAGFRAMRSPVPGLEEIFGARIPGRIRNNFV